MGSNRYPRALVAVALIAGLVVPMASLSATAAPAAPSVRLVAGNDEITIVRRRPFPVPLNIGVFAAAVNGAFEVRATRANYDTPVSVERWIDGGATIEPWPADTANGWNGLSGFLRVTARKDSGRLVLDEYQDFCPAMYGGQRVDDTGPLNQTYPMYGCYANPFTLGAVWGIDQGWAVPAVGSDYYYYYGGNTPFLDAKDGHYDVEVAITPTYADLLGVSSTDRTVTVGVTIETNPHCRRTCMRPAPHAPAAGDAPSEPFGHTPVVGAPDPATLPDLIPLPAYGMWVGSHRDGREWLSFGADLWNAGPGNLVVEGYRQPAEDVMDAWQYFLAPDGTVTGKADAGRLEYDTRDGHDHWHFRQFATYQLLDTNKQKIVRSKKEAFCLAPTDAIDMTVPNAEWIPYSVGLGSACGGPSALWIRENLDVGWGDTYYQGLPGQSFEVTDLPNGRYYVAVIANPKDKLIEGNTSNNVSLRRIFLRGTPGHRYVVVPSYHGID
jgi:hypothetical protein